MNWKLWLLLIVHVVAGVGLWAIPRISPGAWDVVKVLAPAHAKALPVIGYYAPLGLLFCQSCLLGFWVAMSHSPRWKRLAGLASGTIYLDVLLFESAYRNILQFMPMLATGTIAILLLFARIWKVDLKRVADRPHDYDRRDIQFSIRGLMLLTLAVALLTAVAKPLWNLEQFRPSPFVFSWTFSFVAIGLASTWATLRSGSPVAPSMAVISLSLLLSCLVCYAHIPDQSPESYLFIASIMCPTSVALLASLLVVRSCGYRLVKRQTRTATNSQATPVS